jgi:hypothetical protein
VKKTSIKSHPNRLLGVAEGNFPRLLACLPACSSSIILTSLLPLRIEPDPFLYNLRHHSTSAGPIAEPLHKGE